jgi:hypothetical protein
MRTMKKRSYFVKVSEGTWLLPGTVPRGSSLLSSISLVLNSNHNESTSRERLQYICCAVLWQGGDGWHKPTSLPSPRSSFDIIRDTPLPTLIQRQTCVLLQHFHSSVASGTVPHSGLLTRPPLLTPRRKSASGAAARSSRRHTIFKIFIFSPFINISQQQSQ